MSDKAKDIYSGFKKILKSPSLGGSGSGSGGRRSSSGSFSLSSALSSFSLSSTPSATSSDAGRTSSLSAKGYGDADLSAAAAAAADEMFNEGKPKKERRSSFSFASWKEKHREKKHAKQAQKDAEKVAVAYGATAATPKAGSSRADVYGRSNSVSSSSGMTPRSQAPTLSRSISHNSHTQPPPRQPQRSLSGRVIETSATSTTTTKTRSNSGNISSGIAAMPSHTTSTQAPPQSGGRTRSSTTSAPPSRESQGRREAAARNRAASSAVRTPQSSSSYSFSARQQEKTRTADRASTMIVDDVATIVKQRGNLAHSNSNSWDSDTDEEGDSFEDSRAPRTRGFSRRSVSMDFMEPQQSNHLISKIWRKLPIQARLYGRNSLDLDLEKDRTSISRSSASKQLRKGDSSGDDYNIPSSPLPDESNIFGDKHIRFNHKVAFTPAEGAYTALESYDDVLVRVCQFAAHDQRRTAIKVQEFLERSMAFLRGTTTKRGQKVSISNEEIRFWRRLARHDWSVEEITLIDGHAPPPGKDLPTGPSARCHSSSSVTEEETDDDEAATPDMSKILKLREVINYCLNTGDSLFTAEDIEEMVTLELLVEEDGWI